MKDPKPPEHEPADGKPSIFKPSQCPYTIISSDIWTSGVCSNPSIREYRVWRGKLPSSHLFYFESRLSSGLMTSLCWPTSFWLVGLFPGPPCTIPAFNKRNDPAYPQRNFDCQDQLSPWLFLIFWPWFPTAKERLPMQVYFARKYNILQPNLKSGRNMFFDSSGSLLN